MLDLGYPTLMLFKNGLDSPVTYYGPYDKVGLEDFLLEETRGLDETQPVYSKVKSITIFHTFLSAYYIKSLFPNFIKAGFF